MKRLIALQLLVLSIVAAQAQRNYTAGEIQAKTDVTYGRFEVMMYSSDVSGTTSTFFLWKNGGNEATSRWNEIDIETFGKSANTWQSNPIWEYNANDQNTKRWEEVHSNIPIAKTWVKFTLEWTPNYIAWYNNDVQVRRILKGENVPANHNRYNNGDSDDPVGYIADPMRMCFNHWATYPGDWLGTWNEANLPSYQFVDWLTYQKWNGSGFDPVSTRYDFNSISEVTSNFNISTHTFTENQCQFSTNAVGVVNGYLWLGIFKSGREAAPSGAQIPAGSVPPVTYNHLLPKKIEAEEFSTQKGMQTETVVATEGTGLNLGYTDAGDYAEYAIEAPATGKYLIDFRVASQNGNAGLAIAIDGVTQITELPIASTGGWQKWVSIKDSITLSAGKHTMRMTVTKSGFNLNWMDVRTAPVQPTLSITVNDRTISDINNLDVSCTATHPQGIAQVQLFIDGQLLRKDNSVPYNWNTATDPNLLSLQAGQHILKAVATATSGETAETSLNIFVLSTQTIALQKGWNLVSINVIPVDSSIASLFSGLDVEIIKDVNSFWRNGQADDLNSLKKITIGAGYLVKMNSPGTLSPIGKPYSGQLANPTTASWQLIGCPYQTARPFSILFNATNCTAIKSFDGFWIPNNSSNSIEYMEPGKAYFIKP